jgi:hypothetical protein
MPLGHHIFPSNYYCFYKLKLQPLGFQQITLKISLFSHFNRQNLLESCHNKLLVIVQLLGGLLVIFGGWNFLL